MLSIGPRLLGPLSTRRGRARVRKIPNNVFAHNDMKWYHMPVVPYWFYSRGQHVLIRGNAMKSMVPHVIRLFVVVAAIGTAVVTDAQEKVSLDKDSHLMGWWKFDETTGATAVDSSKYDRKGTCTGELSFEKNSAEGKIGKALQLALADSVEIKGYKGVTGTKPRTVTAWIKTTKTNGTIVLWGTNDSGKQFSFGHIRGRIGMTPHGGYYYMKKYTNDDKWHHVAVVVAEAELPNLYDNVQLYLDGEVAELDDIGLLGLLPIETGDQLNVRIGGGYEGLIDELRIYDRPLSIDEINAIYQGKSDKPLEKS